MKVKAAPRRYAQSARAESAEATGRRIVAAFLARLMKQWFDEITLDLVAEDAGVTVQTVVRRFGGKEGLLAEAVKILAGQIHARRATPADDIGQMVGKLIEDYEYTGDPVIRLLALEPRHPALRKFLNTGRGYHRDWVSNVFVKQLGRIDAGLRERALDALVIATDVYTWKLLRRDMGRTAPETATAMKRLIQATIADFSKPGNKAEKP